jgi:Amt family ammonium transporter
MGLLICGSIGTAFGQETSGSSSMPQGVNPMGAMMQPTEPGRRGPRIFTRTTFDPGHVAWVALAALGAALIIPGWLFFYHGRTGTPELSRTGGQMLVLAVLLSLLWGLMAHSHAFGLNWGSENALEEELVGPNGQYTGLPFIGGTRHTGLQGLEPEVAADEHEYPLRRRRDLIPHMLFMLFQMLVAVIAPMSLVVLLSARLKRGALIVATIGWSLVVYVPLAHWIWGFGWLRSMGVQDYAGGAVLQMAAGFSVLGVLPVLPRLPTEPPLAAAEHTGFTCLGGALLWAGSLFLNGGSALAAGPSAVAAVTCAHLAACAGAVGWAGATWLRNGKASFGDVVAGAASGLAAIAACSGLVALQSAVVIGLAAGIICRGACAALAARREREMLTVFGIQGVGGCLGMVLTGVFASENFAGSDESGSPIAGLLTGGTQLLQRQLTAAVVAAALAAAGSLVVFGIVRRLSGTRWARDEA